MTTHSTQTGDAGAMAHMVAMRTTRRISLVSCGMGLGAFLAITYLVCSGNRTVAIPRLGSDHYAWISAGSIRRSPHTPHLGQGLVAGLAGGLAEVVWVSLYASATGADAAEVARGVTAALVSGPTAAPVIVGLAIHMALAAALGVMLVIALRPVWLQGRLGNYGAALTALAGVWAVNFLIVLPQLSPGFLELLPYQVTLGSKLLFGLAAGWAFRRQLRLELPAKVKEKGNVL